MRAETVSPEVYFEVKDLLLTASEKVILDHISLKIHKGEIWDSGSRGKWPDGTDTLSYRPSKAGHHGADCRWGSRDRKCK